MNRIVVLGGSSPFTAGLIDALVHTSKSVPAAHLVLHGRDQKNLRLVSNYANIRLRPMGWEVDWDINLESVITDAEIIVHQIRYGDLALRREAEEVCNRYGCLADETLGPGALLTILRIRHLLREISSTIKRVAPRATVINLTNPLSLSTSLMKDSGVVRVLGVCELPDFTAAEIVRLLSIPESEISFEYVGLNHRGFLQNVRHGGRDILNDLIIKIGNGTFSQVRGETIRKLGAIPTKYFPLFSGEDTTPVARAQFLSDIRQQIANELEHDPNNSPPSLRKRYMEWYPLAVVPLIAALSSQLPTRMIATVTSEDRVAYEAHVDVTRDAEELRLVEPATREVAKWVERYREHERHIVDGLCDSKPVEESWLREALRLDPSVQHVDDDICQTMIELAKRVPLL